VQWVAAIVLLALLALPVFAAGAPKLALEKAKIDTNRPVLFDSVANPPPYVPQINPFSILASMNSFKTPVLDHSGKPHQHGHVIQVIVDGGNGRQDPPQTDGMPGGDDSLAYGNFNLICLDGLDDPPKMNEATGLFFSKRYFIPFLPSRAYYLRVWEGNDYATAPYYQDSKEYDAGEDRGGAMITLAVPHPIDVDWKFGPSIPRPQLAKSTK
jgi:hypothetical protein